MADRYDEVLGALTGLANLVKERKEPKIELQWDAFRAEFQTQIDALVAEQVAAKIAAMPVYRGSPVAAFNVEQAIGAGALEGNRYKSIVRDIARDGYANYGWQKVKPLDLWLANQMLEAQVLKYHASMPGTAHPPSDDLKNALKALTSTGSGTGDELVPTEMANQLWEDFFLSSRVVANLMTIDMPTNPFDVPLGLGSVAWRKGTENTSTSSSDPATAKATLTATELVTEQNWSYTLDEDAVVALAPQLRQELGRSGAEAIDDFALNADATATATGNINSDDGTPASDAYYLSAGQDGIRHLFLADNTDMGTDAGGDALADGDITGEMAAMEKYAANPEDLFMVCDVGTYLAGFLALTNTVTVDKFGPAAVVLTGQLAAYRGIPIVVSASMPKTESDGKASTTAASNTLGTIAIPNKRCWYAGFRRQVLIEMDRDIQRRMYIMVTSFREAIAARGTRSSATHTGGVFNILI